MHRAADVAESLANEWRALADRAAEPNAFCEHWFFRASLETLGTGRDIRLIEVRRGSRLIGLLPISPERGYARLPVAFAQNWVHDQMFLATPLIAAGEERAFWEAVLAVLDEADWAPDFLHLRGIVEDGPVHRGLAATGRAQAIVHRETRAFLNSELSSAAYYERAVRPKKRKEIRRLSSRLAEAGPVAVRILEDRAGLGEWCNAFLALERAGWKGREGSALACSPLKALFFERVLAAAWEAGRLQFLRLDVDGRPIAMLVNFLSPPGSFSFKTVFDEDYARFSPGVLIQIENLKVLDRADIAWMDSCAAEDHPMIDSLWMERRPVVRVTVRLKGARRAAVFALCRALEKGSAAVRKALK